MKKTYLQHAKTGQIVALSEDEVKAMTAERKKDWKDTDVVFIRNKSDGREVVISAGEFAKYGDAEKDQWEKLPDPEAREKTILKKVYEDGRSADPVAETETAPAPKTAKA